MTVLPAKGEVIPVTIYFHNPEKPPPPYGRTNDSRTEEMTVTQVMLFADNSTEVWGLLPDGREHHIMWIAPHGDACY